MQKNKSPLRKGAKFISHAGGQPWEILKISGAKIHFADGQTFSKYDAAAAIRCGSWLPFNG